ncbi:hypothetical protein Xinn_00266 [Xenorhabdus innexi]|uniref:Uncharacterized protein n=1 Tax=Xenorhabdus innexi TaxID=290109 RepID=A0ABX4LED8_9GAMM|nr:hypothetical protein Xinn_00266 [Xenorhabdus innexi]
MGYFEVTCNRFTKGADKLEIKLRYNVGDAINYLGKWQFYFSM